MGEHVLPYIEWLTEKFYAFTDSLGLHLAHQPMVHVWMALFIVIFCALFFGFWRKRYSVYPGITQQVLEVYYGFIEKLVTDFMGQAGKKYIPVIGTLGLFIVLGNLMGQIPIFDSPTSNINMTLGCALFIFVYYHAQGIREHGFWKYIKHFAGPVWWLAILFIPVEVISHFSRPLSLTIRLFGNIFGEHTVKSILFGLFAFLVPLPMMVLAVFMGLIQALVFIMLSCVYISGAIAHEESHHDEHESNEESLAEMAAY
jgi:F-type H+-transporting ATPase subunit a